MQITNVGTSGGNLCAYIYVFAPNQEISECCGCKLTPDGLRTLSVNRDITGNPLTSGASPSSGTIKIVSAATTSGACPLAGLVYQQAEARARGSRMGDSHPVLHRPFGLRCNRDGVSGQRSERGRAGRAGQLSATELFWMARALANVRAVKRSLTLRQSSPVQTVLPFAPGVAGQTFTVTTTGTPTGAAMVITAGSGFPSLVTLTNNHNGTATISGTPASGTAGTSGSPASQAYPVTITANNGVSPNFTQNFTLNITCPAITVSGTGSFTLQATWP